MRCFGEFLVARELIDAESLQEALTQQEQTIVPLGLLAVQSNYLTKEQVRLIEETQRFLDRKLGEIALDREWLTSEQLRNLLNEQSERRVRLGELLIRRGRLGRVDMETALGEFEELQAEHTRQLQELLAKLPSSEVIRSLLDFTAKHYLRTTSEPVKISALTFERALTLPQNEQPIHFFSQSATGDRSLVYGLLMERSMILEIASRMLHEERTELDELVLDSICEFVNMVVGNCFAKLARDGIRLHPDPPSHRTGEEAARGMSGCTRVEVLSRSGFFNVVFSFPSRD